jgi:hypothetical protein
MYRLPYAGVIVKNLPEERREKHGYHQSDKASGFWTHDTRLISFTLLVDDFGVKHIGEQYANHLISVLEEFYEIEKYWTGQKYCGITLDWDYDRQKVHLSMSGY